MNSHARLLKLGLDGDPVVATKLLAAYASLRAPPSLSYADHLFSRVPPRSRDPILLTALLFSAAAAAAASSGDLAAAPSIHAQALRRGLLTNVVVATSLLHMYSKCGALVPSRKVFDEMPLRNTVTYNAMLAAYSNAGSFAPALDLFYRMRCHLVVGVDEFSISSALAACAGLGDLRSGAQIHGFFVVVGFDSDNAIANATANLYFRCGGVSSAERAMEGKAECRSVGSALMMIKGYIFNERYIDALNCLRRHVCSLVELALMDTSVVVLILSACARLGSLGLGKRVHGLALTLGIYWNRNGSNGDSAILGSALIDMYCKCRSINKAWLIFSSLEQKHVSHWNSMITGFIYNGLVDDARRMFDEMPEKNVISWTSMISGYIQHGLPHEGLTLLRRLYSEDGSVQANSVTFATALDACSCMAALDFGKQIHTQALRTLLGGQSNELVVETALVDMYSKSGNLNYARRVFDQMRDKNVVSWTSMITGYSSHGLGLEAIDLLEKMINAGYEPNEVTFIAVLSACSHCGFVEQGMQYFDLMRERYGINPTIDHYTCMVDMLGRAGRLEEGWKFVENYNKEKNSQEGDSIFGALLGGCKLHENVEIGRKVAVKMIEKKQQTSDTYVAVSNLYAAAEMWDEVYKVREEWRKHSGVQGPGQSQVQTS
ncbi:pentatricopeptide repeat-containing protein At2g13600-like [Ananas comosus]|uniref:Pentatricopeptide repeat-containing protein At2g13600-like n=1 Tax=Ananas comosus TaxID=4615 RepID=A0A6P5FB89_ANACO|nr:pentatricopeptide repeat-containing protein At2g13600-like [Ananas comosus]